MSSYFLTAITYEYAFTFKCRNIPVIIFIGHKENKIADLDQFVNSADTVSPSGKKVFDAYCKACHKDSGIALAPDYTILTTMTPKAIFAALSNGKMRAQGATLSEADRKSVSEWITQTAIKTNEFRKMHLLISQSRQVNLIIPAGVEIKKEQVTEQQNNRGFL